MFMRSTLATLFATLLLSVPASAWEVRVSVVGSGVVDETTPADKLFCSSSQNTPNGTVGATCLAGTPSGEYGQGWTVRYVATPSTGWRFLRWQSDGSTREPVKCDGASGSSTYTGTACQFGTFNNYQTQAVFEDIQEPVPSITGGPAPGATTGRSVSFGFTATNNPGQSTTFTCRLTRGSTLVQDWTPCSGGGKSYSSLEHGAHKFEVRATDPSGLTNLTERSWTVDATPPETTLAPDGPAPGSRTKSRTATFQFSAGADATKYLCRIDAGAIAGQTAPCSSPFTTPELGDGTHTLRVWAEDAFGNVETTPATRTWTIDNAAPDTSITGGPAEGSETEATGATFAFSATEVATYRCSLDGAAATACESPLAVTGLTVGTHTLTVQAVDEAGNADPTPTTRTWRVVDTTAPDTTLAGGPAQDSATEATSATFSFSATEAGAFRCSLDGAAPEPCSSPLTLSGLALGEHTLKVWASDASGNEDPTPATRTWRVVDTTPPDTSFSAGPVEGGSTTDTTAAFSFASTEPGGFRCSLDGAAPADCTSPLALANLAVGTHTLKVWARDAAGNEDATPATRTWTVVGGPVTPQPPTPEKPASQIPARLSRAHAVHRRYTKLSKLTLSGLPAGTSVAVRCRGKRCPTKRFATTAGGTLQLKKFLRRKLRVGTVLVITVTKPGHVGKRFALTIRARRAPRVRVFCLHPGQSRPQAC